MKRGLVCFLLIAMARSGKDDEEGEKVTKTLKYPLIKGCLEISEFNSEFIKEINPDYNEDSKNDMSKYVGLKELINFDNRIGKGAFGSVYKIKFAKKNASVKVYYISSDTDYDQTSKQYAKEIEAISQMQESKDGKKKTSKITFEYYGCAQDDSNLYIVQELLYKDLEDKEIKTMIRSATKKVRIGIYIKIAEVLALMHKKKYIHEDVKRNNLMVRSKEKDLKDLEFRVVDFGTASPVNEIGKTGDLRFANPSKLPKDRSYPETNAIPFDDVFSLVITIITLEGKAEDIYEPEYDENNTKYLAIINPLKAEQNSLKEQIAKAVDEKTISELTNKLATVKKTLESHTLMGYKCKDDTFDMKCRDYVYKRSSDILEIAEGNKDLLPILEDCIYNGEKGQFKNMDELIGGLKKVLTQQTIDVVRPNQSNNLGKSTINNISRPSQLKSVIGKGQNRGIVHI